MSGWTPTVSWASLSLLLSELAEAPHGDVECRHDERFTAPSVRGPFGVFLHTSTGWRGEIVEARPAGRDCFAVTLECDGLREPGFVELTQPSDFDSRARVELVSPCRSQRSTIQRAFTSHWSSGAH